MAVSHHDATLNSDELAHHMPGRNLDDRFFRKSFLKTRVVIGVIGVLLPIVLVGGNRVVLDSPTSCHRSAVITTRICATGSSAAFGPSVPACSCTSRPAAT